LPALSPFSPSFSLLSLCLLLIDNDIPPNNSLLLQRQLESVAVAAALLFDVEELPVLSPFSPSILYCWCSSCWSTVTFLSITPSCCEGKLNQWRSGCCLHVKSPRGPWCFCLVVAVAPKQCILCSNYKRETKIVLKWKLK
jgi:hypothetical protein